MQRNMQMEQFSLAFVRAIGSAAGFKVDRPEVDDESVDLTISGESASNRRRFRFLRLDCQVKCTTVEAIREENIHYALPVKNFNDLCTDEVLVPRILIVVIVPRNVDEWVDQTEENLIAKHCGYWTSLRGLPETANHESRTVRVPREFQLSVNSLKNIMERIGEGQLP